MANPKAIFTNTQGSVMVDRTYKNLQLIGITSQSAGNRHIKGIGSKPWVWGIHAPGGAIYCSSFNPYLSDSFDQWYLSNAATFYHFGIKNFVKADPGLNIYDDNRNLVFSSNIQPFRVVDFISGKFDVSQIVVGHVIYEKLLKPNRKYAVVCGQFPYRYWATGMLYCIAPKITTEVSTGRVKIEFALAGSKSSGSYRGNMYTNDYNYLIIDVTGY